MAVTEPSDIADINHDGKSDTTDATNQMAAEKGFPMELAAGGVVLIVKKHPAAQQRTMYEAADGTLYVHSGAYYGPLIEADGVTDLDPQERLDELQAEQVNLDVEASEQALTEALEAEAVTETVEEEQGAGQEEGE